MSGMRCQSPSISVPSLCKTPMPLHALPQKPIAHVFSDNNVTAQCRPPHYNDHVPLKKVQDSKLHNNSELGGFCRWAFRHMPRHHTMIIDHTLTSAFHTSHTPHTFSQPKVPASCSYSQFLNRAHTCKTQSRPDNIYLSENNRNQRPYFFVIHL